VTDRQYLGAEIEQLLAYVCESSPMLEGIRNSDPDQSTFLALEHKLFEFDPSGENVSGAVQETKVLPPSRRAAAWLDRRHQ